MFAEAAGAAALKLAEAELALSPWLVLAGPAAALRLAEDELALLLVAAAQAQLAALAAP